MKATVRQKSQILLLMEHSCFTSEERQKVNDVIGSYSEQKAYKVLYQLAILYKKRTGNPIQWKYYDLPKEFKRV